MWFALATLGCGSSPVAPKDPESASIEVFAAASLTDVLPRVADAWRGASGATATFSFESSSTLAKAVESGQPADVFVAADVDWMDYLDEAGLLVPGSRRDLAGNRLVAVVPVGAAQAPTSATDLTNADAWPRLAMAGDNVPAGKYGRAALASAGVWDAVAARVVRGANVRAALTWVATGEAEVGVVYATDALAEPKVRVALTFPRDAHPPIVYPAAVLATADAPRASSFLAFCEGPVAKQIFADAGFSAPDAP
jgi:molybdate transport system substrate-binding protein